MWREISLGRLGFKTHTSLGRVIEKLMGADYGESFIHVTPGLETPWASVCLTLKKSEG